MQLVAKDVPDAPAAAVEALDQAVEKDQDLKDAHAEIADAHEPIVALPPGWQGKELVVTVVDALDAKQVSRVVIAARPAPGGAKAIRLDVTESVAKAAPAFITQLVARQ